MMPHNAKRKRQLAQGNLLSGNKGGSSSTQAKTMAELMAKATKQVAHLQKGDIVKGTVSKITNDGVLVDIKAKTDALVLEKDNRLLRSMLAHIQVGDEVTVTVLSPESDMGYPVVSLRRYIDDLQWQELGKKQQEQTPIEVTVRDMTKGGFLVESKIGPAGFLPNSQILPSTDTKDLSGKRLEVYVVELNRAARRCIVSQKAVMGEKEFSTITSSLKVGQHVKATITNVAPFGLFTFVEDNASLTGFIHVSEVSWEEVEDLAGSFAVGQTVDAVIVGFDKQEKRVELSLKRMTSDPFTAAVEGIAVDQKVKGIVTHLTDLGVAVAIEKADGTTVDGLIRTEKIPPTMSYKEGDSVSAIVTQIDTKKRKVFLVPALTVKPMGYR